MFDPIDLTQFSHALGCELVNVFAISRIVVYSYSKVLYKSGGYRNEKLDVKVLLPPPLYDSTIILDPPNATAKCTYIIQSSYTCHIQYMYMYRNLYILYHSLSQQLFQCICNIISQWAKYVHRYVPHFCFSCFVINYSTYVGFSKGYYTKPRNDAICSLCIKARLGGQKNSL